MISFNLIDNPWIPCVSSGKVTERSLRDVFAHAGEIQEVADTSPLVTVALHRLLLAVAHTVFKPMMPDAWHALWDRRGWDRERVDAYLEEWHHRFDLFDEHRPFYQLAPNHFHAYQNKYERPVDNLTHEWGPANRRMFSHTPDDFVLSAAEAARYTLAFLCFASGGLYTHEEGRVPDKYTKDAPLARSAVCLIQGDNLFETLMLNMVDYAPRHDTPFATHGPDLPAWESDEVAQPVARHPHGYLDWLTWQSRRIRLVPDVSDGQVKVSRAVIMKGCQLPDGAVLSDYEQMAAFRMLEKPKPGQDPNPVIGFERERALWRDSLALFTTEAGEEARGGIRPKTLTQLARRDRSGRGIRPVAFSGAAMHQYNVLFWRQESFALPLAYLDDKNLQGRLREALDLTEWVGRILGHATDHLAALLLAPDSSDPAGRQPDRDAVRTLAASFGTGRLYWSQLEARFARFLVDQAQDFTVEEGYVEYGHMAFLAWARDLRTAAHRSLDEVTNALSPDPRSLHATVLAQELLMNRLARLWREHVPQEERNVAA